MTKEQDIGLLSKAIESINSVSTTLMQYYATLEDRVKVLTEEVDQKKQLLDSILASVDVGVVYFDQQGIVQLINKTAETLLGIDAETVIGSDSILAEINEDDIVPERAEPFHAIVSRSEVFRADGSSNGKVLIFKDITGLRRLEAENERNRRLSAMGELVMKIAHEIRNPLGSIELFANILANDLKDNEQSDYARRISNSVRSLVSTLDNMLRFSGEIRAKLEFCSLTEIARETCDEFSSLLAGSGVAIELAYDREYKLFLDRTLIRQALINIMLNAVQAMPDGGLVRVQISAVSAKGMSEEQEVRISVKDSGHGMDAETRARIFEPFYSTKDRGTGLGMSITLGIINAHGGRIDIDSFPGKGTEFLIILPSDKRTR